MEFMKYRYREIGERVCFYRKRKNLTQESFSEYSSEKALINANVLSKIENGDIFGKNKSFIPPKILSALSDVLDITQTQIVFGEKSDISQFVREIFYQVATNINPTALSFSEEILDSTRAIQKCMCWSGMLSFIISPQNYNGYEYFNYQSELLDNDLKQLFMLSSPSEEMYFHYLGILWEMLGEKLITSFDSIVLKDEKLDFKKIDKKILEWISRDLVKIVESTEEILKRKEFFSIGFEVYNIAIELRQIEKEAISKNDMLVQIKYQSVTEYLDNKFEILASKVKSLDGEFRLEKPSIKLKKIGESTESIEEINYLEFINGFNYYVDRYLESNNQQMVIPELVGSQAYLIQDEKYKSYMKFAKELVKIQEKYLFVIDLNEIKNRI